MFDELAIFELHDECKRCTKCRKLLPLSEFHKSSKTRSGYKHYCKTCAREHLREWQDRNTEHIAAYKKKYFDEHPEVVERARARERRKYHEDPLKARGERLRYKYGITLDEYREMEAQQGGVCAICGQKCKTGRDLAVDHNHTTGEVRALLCGKCNKGIGLFDEKPELFAAAVAYLLSYQDVLKGATQ